MLDSIRSCSCNGSVTNGLECIHTNRQIATTVSVNRFVLNSIGSRSCKLWLYMLWNIVTCCDTLWYAAICSDVLLTHRQASILWKWWWYAAIYSEMLWYVVINYRYILSFPLSTIQKKSIRPFRASVILVAAPSLLGIALQLPTIEPDHPWHRISANECACAMAHYSSKTTATSR